LFEPYFSALFVGLLWSSLFAPYGIITAYGQASPYSSNGLHFWQPFTLQHFGEDSQ
jgi:hypothetical protein